MDKFLIKLPKPKDGHPSSSSSQPFVSSQDLLNGCLVCYIERSIFKNVSNDAIIDRFQNMKTRRGQL